jgi:hypothetical protein
LALIASDSKPLELLKDAAPGMSSVAYLYDPATLPGTWGNARLEWYQDQARILDIALEPVALSKPGETDEVFGALPAGTNGLLLQSSPVHFLAQDRICALAAAHRLPSASTDNGAAAAGCLISYGEDQADIARRRADYVDRILKGTPPADLPVEQPTTFKLIINLKTAKQGAQLCFNGDFPVDRSEYSPLASRYDEFGGWRPCPDAATRMLKMKHRAAFHPRGLGGIPSAEAQSAPSPNVSCLV